MIETYKGNSLFSGLDAAMRGVATTNAPFDFIPQPTERSSILDIDVTADADAAGVETSPSVEASHEMQEPQNGVGTIHSSPIGSGTAYGMVTEQVGFAPYGGQIFGANGIPGLNGTSVIGNISPGYQAGVYNLGQTSLGVAPQGQFNAYPSSEIPVTSFMLSKEHPFVTTNGYTFFFDEKGLHGCAPGEKARTVHICSPLTITKVLTNEQGIVIAKQIQVGIRYINLMIEDITNNFKRCRGILAANGLALKGHPQAAHVLQVFLLEYPAVTTVLGVTRSGWHLQCPHWYYALPWFAASPNGYPLPVYLGVDVSTPVYVPSLEPWQNEIGRLCRGNTRLVFAIAFALSTMLFRDFGLKGCILHLFGPSSKGKSTILEVAASIFPGGREKFYKKWRATTNGMESRLLDYNDCCVVLDEIAEIRPRDLFDLIYIIGNGAGKMRMTDRERHATTDIRVGVISSGEISIRSHLASGGCKHTGGQAVRAIDVPALPDGQDGVFDNLPDGFSPAQLSKHLTNASRTTFGSVMPALLNVLICDRPSEFATIKKYQQRFLHEGLPTGLDAQAERVSQYFTLAAAVGEYAIEANVLPFEKGESFTAAQICFRAWHDHFRENTLSEADKIKEHLNMIFRRYETSRFLEYRGRKSKELGGAYGYRQTKGSQTDYILPREGFEKMFTGFDPALVRSALHRMGMLVTAGRDLQISRVLPGSDRTKCTVIRIVSDQYTLPDEAAIQ